MTTTHANLTRTVGQLVTENPRRSKVFERFGIDYCCGGKKPLQEACETSGVASGEVLRALDEMEAQAPKGDTRDWNSAPLGELADHIVATHHDYLRQALPRIDVLTEKVARVHGPRRPELIQVRQIFEDFRDELMQHMFKEEQILFPMLRELDHLQAEPHFHCGSVANPISVMEHEHDNAGNALAEMRRLTNGYTPPEDACNTLRATLDALAELEADMHLHVHLENNILFPRGVQLERKLRSKGCCSGH